MQKMEPCDDAAAQSRHHHLHDCLHPILVHTTPYDDSMPWDIDPSVVVVSSLLMLLDSKGIDQG